MLLDTRVFEKLVYALVWGVLLFTTGAALADTSKQPNVIFVFSDDQRYNSLSMTGNPVTQTPNLDQLAKEGVFFNHAFITSPICGPSRANIFTGQWERRNKIGFNYISQNVIDEQTFQRSWLAQLQQAGYSTAHIGKHHSKIVDQDDMPMRKTLDFAYFNRGHVGFYLDQKPVFSNLKNNTQIEGFLEATKAFLSQSDEYNYFYKNATKRTKLGLKRRDPDKPFAAWINFNLPHAASIGGMGSRQTDPEHYRSLYSDKVEQIPMPDYPIEQSTLPDNVFAQSDLMPYYNVSDKKRLQQKKLMMSRAVYSIDKFIGDLRVYLEQIGEADNTIIVFTSDNGLLLGEHGLGGKSILYDENIHVPLIVYSPYFSSRTKGKQVSDIVVGQDIPATILDLLGLTVPDSYQGQSFVPLLNGEQVSWREDILIENLFTDQGYPRQEGVRTKEYKYIRSFSKEFDRKRYLPEHSIKTKEQPIFEELFDVIADPNERNNLVSDPNYKKVLEYFRSRTSLLVSELID